MNYRLIFVKTEHIKPIPFKYYKMVNWEKVFKEENPDDFIITIATSSGENSCFYSKNDVFCKEFESNEDNEICKAFPDFILISKSIILEDEQINFLPH